MVVDNSVRCFLVTVWVCLVLSVVSGNEFILEAEDAIFDRGRSTRAMVRSEASQGKAVSVRAGNSFHFDFCLEADANVSVKHLHYSNDGPPDTVSVQIDTEVVAEITTRALYSRGKGWNLFVLGGDEASRKTLVKEGRHRLVVTMTASDFYGAEIDYITLHVDRNQSEFEFKCMVYCFNNIKYQPDRPMANVPLAHIQQKSESTDCAEEDNVNIPVFGRGVSKYSVTATLPQYRSFNNSRHPDFTNCKMVSALWSFTDIVFVTDDREGNRFYKSSIGPKYTKHIHGDVAALIAGINSEMKMMISITFSLEGPQIGVVDSEIGSRLYVQFGRIQDTVTMTMEYKGRQNVWIKTKPEVFYPGHGSHLWHIPDFTWREGSGNRIKFEILAKDLVFTSYENIVDIEKIELSRRFKEKTKAFHMYNDGRYLVEGASIDFWWLVNQTMTVTILDNGETFRTADYFRIYHNVPWAKDHFSQVFVIYQDGNIRLLPITPHALDWIPFGSSILIGQSDPLHPRPSASIRHIDIDMKNLRLDLHFSDNGFIAISIVSSATETKLIVENRHLARDQGRYPFLTFRSMWVADGNADVDHVSVDGHEAKHVMSAWRQINGRSFAFFRKCISQHNTQSPDLLVDVIA